ncbi:hypothetical protein MXL82_04960 [Staphylococcus gallinarum]|uniref:DUF6978 family protein n=1 Tax=Staphylococcus gallinarum TaxID=1293 RepID=UPI002DB75F00|nr:hypothetical protein [Staphylococcus gallinarum]MEB6242400.1 hypothetical protein [Staphylococcus gallinarum]MEB6295577.1 hypothetical protein [Staphylococcus gallinarum]
MEDFNDLSDEKVRQLIDELKMPESRINTKELESAFGSYKDKQDIVSFNLGIDYILHIYRGNYESDRFTVGIRFKNLNHQLVRIDVNGGEHTNPDDTVAPTTHIHIYNNKFEKKDRYAYAIDINEFPIISNLYDVYMSFLEYNNIKEI